MLSPPCAEQSWAAAGSAGYRPQRGGRAGNVLGRPADIRPGNSAMYYPEANTLVPARADPRSATPPFKNTLVTITPTALGRLPDRPPSRDRDLPDPLTLRLDPLVLRSPDRPALS
jgi:hypothetical protein